MYQILLTTNEKTITERKVEKHFSSISFPQKGIASLPYDLVQDFTYDVRIDSCFGLNLWPTYIKHLGDISTIENALRGAIAKKYEVSESSVHDIAIMPPQDETNSNTIKVSRTWSLSSKFAYKYYDISYKINNLHSLLYSVGWQELSYDTDEEDNAIEEYLASQNNSLDETESETTLLEIQGEAADYNSFS